MLHKKILKNSFIAKLTILSDAQFIRPAQEFVTRYARFFNFGEEELSKIELITEEALVNAIENSFEKDEPGNIDIKIIYKPGEFVISVEDKGLPVDFKKLETHEDSAIGIMLMKNLADEFNFINLGKEGKKIELVKYLPQEVISNILSQEEKTQIEKESHLVAQDAPSIRIIEAGDAEMLSRLAFRVYGYTYMTAFYFPDQIRELIESGLLVSAVCVNKNNEIVGNLSLMYEYPGARVADSGAAMVDPRYRGHNLFKEMKMFLSEYGKRTNMYGLYSEAVTIHTFTQQGNITLGAKETGIMLAFAKEKITFKKINNDKTLGQRQAVVLFYLRTSKEPRRTVYLCPSFYPVLKKIYDNLDLDREIHLVENFETLQPSCPLSSVETSVKPDLNIANIFLKKIGADAFDLIRHQLKEFCLKKIETIYVAMPLSEPYSAVLVEKLRQAGFLLSGIVPEFHEGDVLKMQYLNNVIVDPEKINLASEVAKELLAEIMKDYK